MAFIGFIIAIAIFAILFQWFWNTYLTDKLNAQSIEYHDAFWMLILIKLLFHI
jgi:hypothetical protein